MTTADWETLDARAILERGFAQFGDRIALSTAFGPSGVVLMHLAAQVNPKAWAFFLDTGFHFPETLAMVDRVRDKLGIRIEVIRPEPLVDITERGRAEPLHRTDADACCGERKVEPTERVLRGLDAWVTGLRRDQGPSRAQTPVASPRLVDGRTVLKLNPLVTWTRKDVWRHLFEHDLPYNPLHDQGYASVGCHPCTVPSDDENDERAGRWAGAAKTECGLHTRI